MPKNNYWDSVKNFGYAGYMAGICSKAHREGMAIKSAFLTTRTGKAFIQGLKPPVFDFVNAEPCKIVHPKEVFSNAMLNREQGLIHNLNSKAVAFLEDIEPEFVKCSNSKVAQIKSQVSDIKIEYDSYFFKLSEQHQATFRHLALIASTLYVKNQSHLNQLKTANKQWENPDILWHLLLQSFATQGRSSAADEFLNNASIYNLVKLEYLDSLSESERMDSVTKAVTRGGLRFPDKKAKYIISAFHKIKKLGGLSIVKQKIDNSESAKTIIQFLKTFDGIGDKYSRNLMMDIYHPKFKNFIAIDERIKNISLANNLPFKEGDYDEHEAFYLAIARSLKIEGWELDRLMYHYSSEFMKV